MGFISLVDEIQFMLMSDRYFCTSCASKRILTLSLCPLRLQPASVSYSCFLFSSLSPSPTRKGDLCSHCYTPSKTFYWQTMPQRRMKKNSKGCDGKLWKRTVHVSRRNVIYIYTAVCKNFEPLIYISIYIYGVHCGKVLVLENIPGHKKIINM